MPQKECVKKDESDMVHSVDEGLLVEIKSL